MIFKNVTKCSLPIPVAFPEYLVLFGKPDKYSYPIPLCCIWIPYFLFCKVKNYHCPGPFMSKTTRHWNTKTELLYHCSKCPNLRLAARQVSLRILPETRRMKLNMSRLKFNVDEKKIQVKFHSQKSVIDNSQVPNWRTKEAKPKQSEKPRVQVLIHDQTQ